MTAIVGVRYKGGVVLGADSVATQYDGSQRELRDRKVFELSETVAIAACGSIRVKQAVEYGFDDFDGPSLGEDELRWSVKRFVPALRDILHAAGTLVVDDKTQVEAIPESAFLLAVRDRLFTVDDDFAVWEHKHAWAADGSGAEVASGSLAETIGKRAQEKITEPDARDATIAAVQAASNLTAYVRGRIVTVLTARASADELKLARSLLRR